MHLWPRPRYQQMSHDFQEDFMHTTHSPQFISEYLPMFQTQLTVWFADFDAIDISHEMSPAYVPDKQGVSQGTIPWPLKHHSRVEAHHHIANATHHLRSCTVWGPHWKPGTEWCHAVSEHSPGTVSSPAGMVQPAAGQLPAAAAAAAGMEPAVGPAGRQVAAGHPHHLAWHHQQRDPGRHRQRR